MIREYKTIEEVAGPLMLVRRVEGVKYDELGEIELPDGSVRRCRVLEVTATMSSFSFLKAPRDLTLRRARCVFSVTELSSAFRPICSDVFFPVWARLLTAVPK